jgi:WD40 repeat protein
MHRPGDANAGINVTGTNPDWVKAKARTGGAVAIYTCAVSSDDRYFAVGGGDHKIHLWDLRSQQYAAVRAPASLTVCLQAYMSSQRMTCVQHVRHVRLNLVDLD